MGARLASRLAGNTVVHHPGEHETRRLITQGQRHQERVEIEY
jgi:hypothetical protein